MSDADFELPEDDEVFKEMEDIDGFGQNFWAENEGAEGESYLTNIVGAIDTKSDALRKMTSAVRALSRMSFRRRSSIGGGLLTDTQKAANSTVGGGDAVNNSHDGELSMIGKTPPTTLPLFRQRKRIAQMVEAWIPASAGENLTRVTAMKEMLEGSATLADEFFEMETLPEKDNSDDVGSPTALPTEQSVFTFDDHATDSPQSARKSPLAGGSSGIRGYAYKLLDVLPSMKDVANADTKISQAFEILCAAANAATDVPAPMPPSVVQALKFALMNTWRPPLTTFFALRFAISLWPKEALEYCRHVLLHCLNFQFRVVDAALVCVAEEAVDGQLANPAQWVEPALAVITHATSTNMSHEMLTLAVDILSFSFSFGGVSTFLEKGGIKVIEQAIQALDTTVVPAEATRRLIKLLNPQSLLNASNRPPSPQFGLAGSPFTSPDEPSIIAFEKPALTDLNYREILGAVYTVVTKYNGSEVAAPEGSPTGQHTGENESLLLDSQLCEEASIILYSVMQLAFDLCVEENALSTFCSCITSSPGLWKCKGAVKSTLFVILRYVQLHDAQQKEESKYQLNDDPVVSNIPVDPTTGGANYKLTVNSAIHNSSSPQYYRVIMESSILAVVSLSVRLFHNEDMDKCPHMGPVYKLINIICLAEPAKQHFLRGCPAHDYEDDDAPEFSNTTMTNGSQLTGDGSPDNQKVMDRSALIPNLVYCLVKSTHSDHQFFVLNILYRICRGSQQEFCSQLLGPLPAGTLSAGVAAHRKSHHGTTPLIKEEKAERDVNSSSGAFLRTLARRIGTWKPRLLPAALGLCRELSRFLMSYGTTLPYVTRPVSETFYSSVQSIIATYRAEPNIVAAGTISLGHLCRCPQGSFGSHFAGLVGSQYQPSEDPGLQVTPSFSIGMLNTSDNLQIAPLLKFGLDHDLMDLAMQLRHGAFADAAESSVNPASSSQSEAPSGNTQVPPSPSPQQLVFSHNMPLVVRNALGYLFACISMSPEMVSILLDEGALALMKATAQSKETNQSLSVAREQESLETPTAAQQSPMASQITEKHSVAAASSVMSADSSQILGGGKSTTDSRIAPTPRGASKMAKAVQSFSSVLLTREDRDFIRKQVVRLEKIQRELEESKKPPAPAVVPTAEQNPAPTNSPTSAMAKQQLDAIHQLELLFAKQQAALLSDYEHRRIVEIEDEILIRESLRQQFASKTTELVARLEGRHESLQRARNELEDRYNFGRKQIEQFQQESFLDLMSYTNRSMQKKMTVMVLRQRQQTDYGSSEGEHSTVTNNRHRHRRGTNSDPFGPMGRSISVAPDAIMCQSSKDSPLESAYIPPPIILQSAAQGSTSPNTSQMDPSFHHYSHPGLRVTSASSVAEFQAEKDLLAAQQTLAIQTSNALATMMETLQATHAAVERLKQQQESMKRDLMLIPQRPTSAEILGGSLVSRPQSSPTFRGASSNRSRRRRFDQTPPLPMSAAREQQYGDAGIYEDRSPSPADLIVGSPPPPAPPAHQRPTSRTFRSQVATSMASEEESLRVPTRPSTAKNGQQQLHAATAAPIRSPSKVNANGRVGELQVSLLHNKETTTIVDLNRNYLGDGGLLALIPTLQQLPNLEVLLIEQNGLSGASIVPLMVEVLMAKPNFHHLSLNDNRDVTPRVGRDLIAFVKAKPSMLVLDVEGTQIFVESGKILKRLLQERLANAKAMDIMNAERAAPSKKEEDHPSPRVIATAENN